MSNPGTKRYRAPAGRDLSKENDPNFAERQGALPAPPKKKKKKEKRGCIVM
jgi:hypothetical protein